LIGVVIVTHRNLGEEFLRTAEEIVGELPGVEVVSIQASEKIEKARGKIEAAIRAVDQGSGVLIFTDMFGGTPSNLGLSFLEKESLEVITGINLPMLIKLPSLRQEGSLKEVAQRLCRYGQKNILAASDFLAKRRSGIDTEGDEGSGTKQ
jgi:mannose PTS system EIIA component